MIKTQAYFTVGGGASYTENAIQSEIPKKIKSNSQIKGYLCLSNKT